MAVFIHAYILIFDFLYRTSFGFSNESLTIIVGKNNVGKTKLLEYIFLENRKWDGFDDEYEGGYTKSLPIFFREGFNVCVPNHEYYAKLERKGRISVVMENDKMEETKIIEPLMLEIKDEEDDFDIDVDNRVGGRNSAVKISYPLSGVGSGLIKSKTLQSLIEKIIDKNKTESSKLNKPVDR
ncbi:hypothetical protein C1645_837831 [Glomus cerebriforme]|uniref:Endonuclease GajA/Old nuclease/RecF-like AAA domain-containing protein n=1 Tax=Glomus cerebriforme TaxID=658196 RepID=A0A397S842_9GLOM|nr:hypothetical protein C1645_837831 [Glomus cerebriforme]